MYTREEFRDAIRTIYNIDNPYVANLWDNWLENKADFREKFGDSLIYEYPTPVKFTSTDEQNRHTFNMMIRRVDARVEDFLTRQGFAAFFKNEVVNEYTAPDGTVIKPGSKLLKSLKHIILEEEDLRFTQDWLSGYIQKQSIEGTLCLSIHPLDYLTISTNAHNWQSCHSIGGEYQAGNLAYMADKSTIVAYIKGNEPTILGHEFIWNSKKWRQLIYVSDNRDMMFLSRQYPFKIGDDALKLIAEIMPDFRADDKIWSEPTNFVTNRALVPNNLPIYGNYIPLPNKIVEIHDMFAKGDHLHYNDVLFNREYSYSFLRAPIKDECWWTMADNSYLVNDNVKFSVGDVPVRCLRCGRYHIEYSFTVMCSDCELMYGQSNNDTFGFCTCCGSHEWADNLSYIERQDGYICDECYRKYYKCCDGCCDDIPIEQAYEVDGNYYCWECAPKVECKHCGSEIIKGEEYETEYGVFCDSYCAEHYEEGEEE